MRASRIILLLVALIAGGLAAFLATRNDAPQQVAVEGPTKIIEEKKAQILVAKTPIGVGQRLSDEAVEWQDWPELAVRPEYVTMEALPDAIEQLTEAVARFEFFPGEPIMETKLVRSAQGYLSAVLAKGMRGVSVEVNAEAASGGYIFPNDRVDVVLTRDADSGMVSQTILANVKILAINRRLGEAGTSGSPADPENPSADVFQDSAIATLELTPEQGELVINSTQVGSLSLVLRSMADYQVASEELVREATSRSIRLIRAGRDSDVMTATSDSKAGVEAASFSEEPEPQMEEQAE
jgi:pilus assembly protein CpaB